MKTIRHLHQVMNDLNNLENDFIKSLDQWDLINGVNKVKFTSHVTAIQIAFQKANSFLALYAKLFKRLTFSQFAADIITPLAGMAPEFLLPELKGRYIVHHKVNIHAMRLEAYVPLHSFTPEQEEDLEELCSMITSLRPEHLIEAWWDTKTNQFVFTESITVSLLDQYTHETDPETLKRAVALHRFCRAVNDLKGEFYDLKTLYGFLPGSLQKLIVKGAHPHDPLSVSVDALIAPAYYTLNTTPAEKAEPLPVE